jgi:hypothetical protein
LSGGGPRVEVRPAPSYSVASDLWVISAFYNSHDYHTKSAALLRYLEAMKSSGVPLLLVEGAFEGARYSLPSSRNVLRVRCKDVMWQKERLLNLALKRLPQSCKKVAWLDADVLFSNPYWAIETSELLDQYPIVQPFETALWLPHGDEFFQGRGLVWPSFAKAFSELPGAFRSGNFDRHGHCGYAWAARRELLERHGFFDRSIAGGGDHLMAHAMGGDFSSLCVQKMVGRNTAYSRDFANWGRPFYRSVRSRIGFTRGHLLHLWHGDKAKRQYSERSRELLEIRFDPRRDIKIGKTGGWEWASDRPELHDWARTYFARREEDALPEDDYRLSRSSLRTIQETNSGRYSSWTRLRERPTLIALRRKRLAEMAKREDWY